MYLVALYAKVSVRSSLTNGATVSIAVHARHHLVRSLIPFTPQEKPSSRGGSFAIGWLYLLAPVWL